MNDWPDRLDSDEDIYGIYIMFRDIFPDGDTTLEIFPDGSGSVRRDGIEVFDFSSFPDAWNKLTIYNDVMHRYYVERYLPELKRRLIDGERLIVFTTGAGGFVAEMEDGRGLATRSDALSLERALRSLNARLSGEDKDG